MTYWPFPSHNRDSSAERYFFATAKLPQTGPNTPSNAPFLHGLKGISFGRWSPSRPIMSHVARILVANLLANMAVLPLFSRCFVSFQFQLPWRVVRPMCSYALPWLLVGLAGAANEMSSRILLKHLLPIG